MKKVFILLAFLGAFTLSSCGDDNENKIDEVVQPSTNQKEPSFSFSVENKTVMKGNPLSMTIGDVAPGSSIIVTVDGVAVDGSNYVYSLPTDIAGDHKINAVVDGKKYDFNYKVMLSALEVYKVSFENDKNEVEKDGALSLSVKVNNQSTIILTRDGIFLDKKENVSEASFNIPTNKLGTYSLKVAINDGQNEPFEKELSYKVLLPALDVQTNMASIKTSLKVDEELKLSVKTNNPSEIKVLVNETELAKNTNSKDETFDLPTSKSGLFNVKLLVNDGQNEIYEKEFSYKVVLPKLEYDVKFNKEGSEFEYGDKIILYVTTNNPSLVDVYVDNYYYLKKKDVTKVEYIVPIGDPGSHKVEVRISDGQNETVTKTIYYVVSNLVIDIEMKDITGGSIKLSSGRWETVKPFKMAAYEVTQSLWKQVMGYNPSKDWGNGKGIGDNYPVNMISWFNARDFIQKLNKLTGKNYRFATPGEWEWAARGGELATTYSGTSDKDQLYKYAYYNHKKDDGPSEVGKFLPNVFGLYDMTGNIGEWIENPNNSTQIGAWADYRGGEWFNEISSVHLGYQCDNSDFYFFVGLRLAMSIED